MSEQICLAELDPSLPAEDKYLTIIKPHLMQAVQNVGGDPELLVLKSKQLPKRFRADYLPVSFNGITAFRLRLHGKSPYISVPAVFADLIRTQWPETVSQKVDGYIRIPVDCQRLNAYTPGLCALVAAAVDRCPKEWDCCSRYQECSDARHCVHPDKTMALSCGYRKILNSGKIYYGVNRNA